MGNGQNDPSRLTGVPKDVLDRVRFVFDGLRDLGEQGGAMYRGLPRKIGNVLRDLPYGMPLGGKVETRYAHLGAYGTSNVTWEMMDVLFASVDVREGDVLVDVGCGKGRSLNWFLHHYPRNALISIELDPTISAMTAKRLRRRRNVVILCGDATQLIPPEGTIFYAFNPFDQPSMKRFADSLCDMRSHGGSPTATIAYLNAKFLSVFVDDSRFAVRELDDPRLDCYPSPSAIITLR